ncbi:MAG: alpha/beta hydrolase [Bacteroidota bacterium]|nr:alpha/beta hydrolase [Bacteroidota bacterium]
MLSYSVQGEGNAIVLLHGFCESKEIWTHFVPTLSKSNKVICIDLPGFGESINHKITTIEAMADSVHETLASIYISNFVLVGHSLGGYVSLAYAEKYGHHLKGLCMFHSTAYADSDEKKANRTKTAKFVQDNGVNAFIIPFVPPLFYPQNRKSCEKSIQLLTSIGCNTPIESIVNATIAMRDRKDRTDVIKNASYPVLYIVGKNDGAIKMEDSVSQCHLAPISQVIFLSDTAHQGLFEKEKETLLALENFMSFCYKIK